MLSDTELKSIQDLAIAAFAREVRAARDFVSLARVLGVPKLRALRARATELEAERQALSATSADRQPQFALRLTLRECPNCHQLHVLGTCPECNP